MMRRVKKKKKSARAHTFHLMFTNESFAEKRILVTKDSISCRINHGLLPSVAYYP